MHDCTFNEDPSLQYFNLKSMNSDIFNLPILFKGVRSMSSAENSSIIMSCRDRWVLNGEISSLVDFISILGMNDDKYQL